MKSNEERLGLLKSRLKTAKTFCKKPHDGFRKWVKEYKIEDFGNTDEIRDKVRIGYIFRKIESELPAIFDDQPDLFIKGRHGDSAEIEPLITGVYDYLWDIQNLEEKIEDAGLFFELLGLGIIKSPWVTKNKKVEEPVMDEQGQPILDQKGKPVMHEYEVPVIDHPMAEASNIFKIYFSPETKFSPLLDYKSCPYLFEEMVMTQEEIKSKFGKDVKSSETMKLDDIDADTTLKNDSESNPSMKDDMKRVTVYEYYGCLPEDMVAKGWEYDKEYHLYITDKEELSFEECPYTSKPYFLLGNYGLANDFWRFGDAKHLMPLVQELEKYRSQILNHNRFAANPSKLVPTNAMVDEETLRNPLPGNIIKYQGDVPPSYMAPAPLGQEVSVGIEMVRTDLEKTAASFDLNGGGGSSQVKSPRGIQVFSEAADRGIRRKKKKVSRLIRQLIIFQFQQVAQNWKPDDSKTIAIIQGGKPSQEPVTQEVLQVLGGVGTMYALDIEVESLSVNKVQIKQEALDLWDLATRSPGIFKMDALAKDMLENAFGKRDADRFLLSEEEKQAMAESQKPTPGENVSIRVDANTPIGALLLEQAGLLPKGAGMQMVQAQQMISQQVQQAGIPQGMGGQLQPPPQLGAGQPELGVPDENQQPAFTG